MSKPLEGKVAIITGSRMGIGKAIARKLASEGASVVINARNKDKLRETEEELLREDYSVLAVSGDISNWEDTETLIRLTVEKFGRIDMVVNNAGAATRGSVEDMAPEVFRNITEVNILGSVFPAKAALPWLKKSGGSITFISSIASFHGLPFNSIYSATKRALTGITESMRLELSEYGIHVGIVYVGFTENEPTKVILDADGREIYLEERKGIKKQTPDQVAHSVYRLIRNRKKSVTLTAMGKGLKFVNWLAPGIISWFLKRNIQTIRANSSGEPVYVNEMKKS